MRIIIRKFQWPHAIFEKVIEIEKCECLPKVSPHGWCYSLSIMRIAKKVFTLNMQYGPSSTGNLLKQFKYEVQPFCNSFGNVLSAIKAAFFYEKTLTLATSNGWLKGAEIKAAIAVGIIFRGNSIFIDPKPDQ